MVKFEFYIKIVFVIDDGLCVLGMGEGGGVNYVFKNMFMDFGKIMLVKII